MRLHGADRRLWWAAPPLMLAARYFSEAVPERVRARLQESCPWLLRRVAHRRTLTDFSYSHLFMDPVPGIAWSRSAMQALQYLRSRVFPDKEQRAQMHVLSRTGPWSDEPQWHRQSQARRILQWLSSRPTRTESLQPVRAALSRGLI